MNEEEAKALAQQLRQPEGEMGLQVGERMNIGNQYMNRHTIEQLDPQAHEHILEIGMGNGFFVNEILSKNETVKYTGCDFSELMVREATKLNTGFIEKEQAQFIYTTADQLPFEDNHFDKVFTINTLYFWEKPEKELAELKRVLKPGGKLFLTIRPKRYIEHFGFTKYGFHMYSQEDAVDLLNKNGWKIMDVIEKTDPPIDWFGEEMKPESLIIIARK